MAFSLAILAFLVAVPAGFALVSWAFQGAPPWFKVCGFVVATLLPFLVLLVFHGDNIDEFTVAMRNRWPGTAGIDGAVGALVGWTGGFSMGMLCRAWNGPRGEPEHDTEGA